MEIFRSYGIVEMERESALTAVLFLLLFHWATLHMVSGFVKIKSLRIETTGEEHEFRRCTDESREVQL